MKDLKYGTPLYTKDGRKIGNAIITRVKDDLFYIKTDYGNTAKLTASEIREQFYTERAVDDKLDIDLTHKNLFFDKSEALNLLREREKVTHPFLTTEQRYIKLLDKETIQLGDGTIFDFDSFWLPRFSSEWKTGFSLWVEED